MTNSDIKPLTVTELKRHSALWAASIAVLAEKHAGAAVTVLTVSEKKPSSVVYAYKDEKVKTVDDIKREIVIMLAGSAACGNEWPQPRDFERAIGLASLILKWNPPANPSEHLAAETAIVEECMERARQIVREHDAAIQLVTNALIERGELTGEELHQLLL